VMKILTLFLSLFLDGFLVLFIYLFIFTRKIKGEKLRRFLLDFFFFFFFFLERMKKRKACLPVCLCLREFLFTHPLLLLIFITSSAISCHVIYLNGSLLSFFSFFHVLPLAFCFFT
jgi:hypothetical protein